MRISSVLDRPNLLDNPVSLAWKHSHAILLVVFFNISLAKTRRDSRYRSFLLKLT